MTNIAIHVTPELFLCMLVLRIMIDFKGHDYNYTIGQRQTLNDWSLYTAKVLSDWYLYTVKILPYVTLLAILFSISFYSILFS